MHSGIIIASWWIWCISRKSGSSLKSPQATTACFAYIIPWLGSKKDIEAFSSWLFSSCFLSPLFSVQHTYAHTYIHSHTFSFGTSARMLLSTRSLTYHRDKKIWGIKIYHVTTSPPWKEGKTEDETLTQRRDTWRDPQRGSIFPLPIPTTDVLHSISRWSCAPPVRQTPNNLSA